MEKTNETMQDFLVKEIETAAANKGLPTMKFEEGKPITVIIDAANPWDERTQEDDSGKEVTKRIIPVMHDGERKNWWLNIKNPIYKEVCEQCLNGNRTVKVFRTGQNNDTRYTLVKE